MTAKDDDMVSLRSTDDRRRMPDLVRRIAGEIDPRYWPLGAGILVRDLVQSLVRLPATPHAHTKVGTVTPKALKAVMDWIAEAQSVPGNGGIPAYFSLYGGYGPPYPETTGYLIPTMIDYARVSGEASFERRALDAARWLRSLQFDSGAFPGGFARASDGPSVFNTGQIIFGLLAAARQGGPVESLEAARRAGAWLISVQSADGAWHQHTYLGESHVYYTMVAWALAELFATTGDQAYRDAAERNLQWALSRQDQKGRFSGFNLQHRPIFLHFIAYTLQGLVEAGTIIERPDVVEAARGPAERLMRRFEIDKKMAGGYDYAWKANASYACLTGEAQMAIVWQRLSRITGDLRFQNAALKVNERIKRTLIYRGPRGIRGGVKGSDPIWGSYLCFRYPNWAAKFVADSFMLELEK